MRLFKNFLSLAGAEALSKVATFASFAYLARVLGPTSFGYIEFAGAVLMCASLIVDQGFSAFGAREIAKAPQQTNKLVAEVVTARFALALGGYLAVALFALLVDRGAIVTRLLLIYGLSLWGLPLLLQWVFQGHDRMHVVAVSQILRQTVFAITVFAFVRNQQQIIMVAWAEVAAVTFTAVFCLLMYRRQFSDGRRFGPAISSRLFREGVPIGLSQMFWVMKMFGGTLLLGIIASAESVGFFAGAQRILVALHTFVWLYFFNLLPSLTRAWQNGPRGFEELIERSTRTVIWIGILITIIWATLSTHAMQIIYGRNFSVAATVLALLSLVWIMTLINGHFRYGLIATGNQDAEMKTAGLGALVALIFVPAGYVQFGINGAAGGMIVAEASIWLSSWWYSRKLLSIRGSGRSIGLPVVAGLSAGAIFWLSPIASTQARFTLAVLVVVATWFASYKFAPRVGSKLVHPTPSEPISQALSQSHDGTACETVGILNHTS